MNGSQKLRAGLYLTVSALLKVAGVYGLVNEEESQAWLLAASAVLDLAFLMVPGNPVKGKLSSGRKHRA